jgi:hypothetical protein
MKLLTTTAFAGQAEGTEWHRTSMMSFLDRINKMNRIFHGFWAMNSEQ